MYSLKSIKSEFKKNGVFYTPNELAHLIKGFIDIDISEVYDPTCGDGQLLSVFPKEIKKYGQEINEAQLKVAKNRLDNFEGICGDTLQNPAFLGKKFDCIVGNPPFSVAWTPKNDERFSKIDLAPKGKADFAFLLHILHYLSEDGIAIVLNFPGILYRGNSEGKIRRYLVESNFIEKIIRVPGKKFIDTNIETVILVFKKSKKTTDIEFFDLEKNLNRKVSFSEIEKNDFNLSISSFLFEEVKKEVIDPILLQKQARSGMIHKLKQNLEFDKKVCEIEGWNHQEFINEIESFLKKYSKY